MHWKNALTGFGLLNPLTATARVGLITDVDGTISPIVDQPDAAQVTARSKELLTALADRLTLVAAVSGRAAADIHGRVGVPDMLYVGNHGMERWVDGAVVVPEAVQEYRVEMERVANSLMDKVREHNMDGVMIEDKGATLSVHYRQSPDRDKAAGELREMVNSMADAAGLRVYEGRMIFEVRPPVSMNKGSAFRTLVDEFKLGAAIYIGDDTTDIDAIVAARELREAGICHGVGVGVASPETPQAVLEAADLSVDGVSGVESFFEWLLSVSSASSS